MAINTPKCETSNEFISTDFGQHSRIRPFMFSLLLHFRGTCALGKTGGKSFNTVEMRGWVTNSLPRSGAIERRSSGESETRREIILSSTYVAAFSKRACQAEIWICGQPASPCRRSPFCLQHFFSTLVVVLSHLVRRIISFPLVVHNFCCIGMLVPMPLFVAVLRL